MTYCLRDGEGTDAMAGHLVEYGHEVVFLGVARPENGVLLLINRPGTEGELAVRVGTPVFGNTLYFENLARESYRDGVCEALRIPIRTDQAGLRVTMGVVWDGDEYVPHTTVSCFGDETGGVALVHQNRRPRLFQATFERLRVLLLTKRVAPNVLWIDATISRADGSPYLSAFSQGYNAALWGLAGLCDGGLGGLVAYTLERRYPAMNTTDYCAYWNGTAGECHFTAPSCYTLTQGLEQMSASPGLARQVSKIKLYKRLRYL